ncbi:MAG: glycosyltransferase family 2 protein [Candidatus Omnitrophota bacterium]
MSFENPQSKILVLIPVFNEDGKILKVVKKIPRDSVDQIVVINDGSTDSTPFDAIGEGVKVLNHDIRRGIGAAIRTGIEYAIANNYDIIVILAGNDKDDPTQINRLVEPIVKDNFDYVQGSRYIKGGISGKMPLHRLIFTKGYSFLIRLCTNCIITDGTNGFRAYRRVIFDDKRINIWQDWLSQSLEYYLSIKVLKLGYKIKEVPVTKIYPTGVSYKAYTKVKPFYGWIERLKPIIYLTLGIKK